MKTKKEMREMLALLLDESRTDAERLDAYEYLMEDCDDIVDEMLEKFYTTEGEANRMLIELLAGYKGNPAIYMGLVSCLYRGEDAALFAHLLGSYGDERAIDVLKSYAAEYELDYNEFIEFRNAIEELGGEFDYDRDFSEDPYYILLKGQNEQDDSRRSPFEEFFRTGAPAYIDEDEDEDECGCGNHHDDDDCGCGHHHDDDDCGCGHRHD